MEMTGALELLPAARRPVAVYSPHPLIPSRDRALIHDQFLPGETIGEYLERTGLLARIGRRPVVLTIDGLRVPRSFWFHCRPKPGTLIRIHAIVRGGGGGKKNPIATIATIALTVWGAPALGNWITSTVQLPLAAGMVIRGAIGIVGGMIINHLFPPPRPALSQAASLPQESPTYSLSGGANRMRPYEPMPVIMGEHRIFFDLGAKPYTEFEGQDQYLYQIFDAGYNEATFTDFRIGTTPLAEFQGVTLEQSGANGALTLFPGNVDTQAVGALTAAAGWVSRTTSPEATAVAVEITGSLFLSSGAGIASLSAQIELQYRAVGAPDWLALAEGEQTLYHTHYWSAGRLFEIAVEGGSVFHWVQVAHGGVAAGERVEGASYDGFNTWHYRPYAEITSAPGAPASEPAPAQTYTVRTSAITLSNDTRTPLRLTFKIPVASGQYEVRARRVTADETDAARVSELHWSQLRSYQPDEFDYTGRKRFALKIKASGQINGAVEQLSAIAHARCSQWNGAAWVTGPASNPAWWFLQALRGRFVNGRRVWGAGIADSRIDLENLKAFGVWCRAEGLTFDGIFDQPMSALEMLSAIALCGRGTVSQANGKWGVVWDAPNQPAVGVYSMSNIELRSFEIAYQTEPLADEIVLSFVNPELSWQRDTVRALVPGTANPVRPRQIELFGCRSKAMAAKAANLYAAANLYRTKRYRWVMDFEGQPATRGDVGLLAHDLASYDYCGRFVEGGNAGTLKLERKVPLFAGGSRVLIVKPDGSFDVYSVQGGSGETDTLTLGAALGYNPWADPTHPPYDYKWLYAPSATPGRLIKIDSIRPLDERRVEILALNEDPAYYAQETNPVVHVTPQQALGGAIALSNLRLTEDGVRAGAGYMARVTATWDASGDYSYADVRASVGGGPMQLRGQEVRGTSLELLIPDRVLVTVEVTAYGRLGRLGQKAVLGASKAVDFAGAFRPSDVAELRLQGRTFSWTPVSDVDVAGYRIRFHYGARRSIEDANSLHQGLLTQTPHAFPELPADVITYLIVAVDAAGLESVNAASVTVDARGFTAEGDPLIANVVETVDFKALGWPGMLTGGAPGAGQLEANTTTSFYAANGAMPKYGSDNASFYGQDFYSEMVYEANPFMVGKALAGSRMTLGYTLAGDPLYPEYRLTGPSSVYGPDAESFYGPDAASFYEAPGGYSAWPGALIAKNEEYQIRVRTGEGLTRGIIGALSAVIDAPDIVETFRDVALAAAGTRLPIARGYVAIQSVSGTLKPDGGAATYFTIEDRDPLLGPLLKARNAAQGAVAGTLSTATVQGY